MKKGWQIIELSDESCKPLRFAIQMMEVYLGSTLEEYLCKDDEQHIKTQSKLANLFIDFGCGRKIIEGSLATFQSLIGMDLHIQRYPYLRIARPGKPQDNIGIHRDTLYGGTPYEVSVVIPLTSATYTGALHVVDGSNIEPEAKYPFEKVDTDVVKNSDKHKLGFVYTKKKLADDLDSHPVVMNVGQALAFPLSLVHGQEVNGSAIPRFSVDIRLVNSLAPIEWSHTVHADYWEPLCASPITQQAKQYYEAQK